MSLDRIIADKSRSIGEVAGVEGDIIEVFVYPEKYEFVSVGKVVVINSGSYNPMGLVLKLSHSSRYGTFTPLKYTRSELEDFYPDLKEYQKFITSIVYTSHFDEGGVKHFRRGMPLLHDLAYIVDSREALKQFFKPSGEWDFTFLNYFVRSGATFVEISEFFKNHMEFFKKEVDDFQVFIARVLDGLRGLSFADLDMVLKVFDEVFGDD